MSLSTVHSVRSKQAATSDALQVLENPRYHSGQGYQTKNSGYYKGK